MRTVIGDARTRRGRLSKALQFQSAADEILELNDDPEDIADAYVTLCVHAGIAASDAICIRHLGRYSKGENHQDAINLLASVNGDAAKHLKSLLALKTQAAYSNETISSEKRIRAGRAMDTLINAAQI